MSKISQVCLLYYFQRNKSVPSKNIDLKFKGIDTRDWNNVLYIFSWFNSSYWGQDLLIVEASRSHSDTR
jgi:hypothetical protein